MFLQFRRSDKCAHKFIKFKVCAFAHKLALEIEKHSTSPRFKYGVNSNGADGNPPEAASMIAHNILF